MKVHGDVKPAEISVGSVPNKPGRAWVRFTQNAKQDENGWVYDEYTTEVEDTPGLLDEVKANREALLMEAKANEKSKAEIVAENALLKAQLAATTERSDFIEDCIAEMAMRVYAE